MDYKEKVIALLNSQELSKEQKEKLENIFPELKEKESEDEKIRKEIYIYLDWLDGRKNFIPKGKYTIRQMIDWLEKQGEKKPTDKVEPKFKVGDWVVSNNNGEFWQIGARYTEEGQRIYLYNVNDVMMSITLDELNNDYHLWTIQDAKNGDVLATDVSVFIYAKVLYNKPYAYCGVDKYGVFKDKCLENDWSNSVDNIHPATKEQHDTLFAKMADAGYEWDADKKELKKIEPKKVNADKVIEWLKGTIREAKEYLGEHGEYYDTHLTLPYDSIEDLINDFKEDFGLC